MPFVPYERVPTTMLSKRDCGSLWDFPGQTSFNMASWCVRIMTGRRRISVRLNDGQSERLERLCRETGSDTSEVIRLALDALGAVKPGSETNNGPPKRATPPEAIFDIVPQYLNQCDLRERKSQFAHLLAVSYVAKKHWPRTPGVNEGYEQLLQLCRYFGFE